MSDKKPNPPSSKPLKPLLEVEDLCIDYLSKDETINAVVDFNLELYPGQKIGLVGESGSGKSTVAYSIMNYMGANRQINSGKILFNGKNILDFSSSELQDLRGNRISMIYQEAMSSLNPVTTVGEQMLEVPLYKIPGMNRESGKTLCLETLSKVKVKYPEKIFNSYPFELSGGQQQRVVIAMALMTQPDLLIMDEPTTSLDVTVEAEIMDLVEELVHEYHTALILISHNLGLVLNTCDAIYVMYSGEIVERGSAESIFNQPQHPYTEGLFRCIPRLFKPGKVTKFSLEPIPGQLPLPWERPEGCWFKDRCKHYREGICDQPVKLTPVAGSTASYAHKVRCERYQEIELFPEQEMTKVTARDFSNRDDVIRVDNLMKVYRQGATGLSFKKDKLYIATNKVNFTVKKGEIISIVGESGSGKSTIAKMIAGLEKASRGSIRFGDDEISKYTADKRKFAIIQAIQMIFQNPADVFNPKVKILPQVERTIRKLLQIKKRSEIKKIINELLEVIRMPADYLDYLPRHLSGGQKQRVAIARTFAGNPSFVIADEPTSALDVSVQASIVEMLLEMQSRHQNTLLFISHDLALVSTISDRVMVLYAGKVMELGTTSDIFSPPYHPYTAVLISATPEIALKTTKHRTRIELAENDLPVANLKNRSKGCPFAAFCPQFLGEKCVTETPTLKEIKPGHQLACHLEKEELEKIAW